jgi:hypothetical protein
MGRLHNAMASARRSRAVWAAAASAAAVLVAGGVLLATESNPPPTPSPQSSTRAVALGDSVPYGHGLANPYLVPQGGLPPDAVSQAPSTDAYPTMVAQSLGLTMTVRPNNCDLTGDQLAISGAVADGADATSSRDTQCPLPARPVRNLSDEVAAADFPLHPARLVLLQIGADDIDFGACLTDELARLGGTGIGLGTPCVTNHAVTPRVATELSNVRTSLATTIEAMAPDTGRIAVLDYYQPIPAPSQIADDSGVSGLGTNLVCAGLKVNAATAYSDAQVVLAALNRAIAGAVADARGHHVANVRLLDVSTVMEGHGLCTVDPWIFSAQPVSDATLAADVQVIIVAKACNATTTIFRGTPCSALLARADQAEQRLRSAVWRAAHPTAAGQRVLAQSVEHQLRGTG